MATRSNVVFALALTVGGAAASWAAPAVPSRPGLVSFRPLAIPGEVPAHLATALAEDTQGFLWIGTQGGLVRFDGSHFRVYRSDPDDPTTLGGSYVRSLLPASDGRLWVGTFGGGLSVFDPSTERFTRFRHSPGNPKSLSHDRVEGLAEDRSGKLWVATDEGLDRIDPKTGRVEVFRHDPGDPRSLADNRTRAVLLDRHGRLWVGTRDGLQVYRGDGRGFERVASEPGRPGSLAGELVFRLYEDARGRLWIGTTEHGAAVLDPGAGRLTRLHDLSHFWIYGITQVTPREIWIATFGGGIDVLDPDSLAVVDRLRHDSSLPDTPGGDRIGSLLKDRRGLVWVGTWGQGIALHDPANRAFRVLRHSPNRPEGLSHPEVVRTLETRDGFLWAGTNGNGVDVLDRELRRIGGYRPDPRDPGALSDGSVTCLAQGPDGSVWVATLDGTLHRLRPGGRRFERFTPALGLPGGAIRTLAFGPDGALWIGSAEGLARLEPVSSRIVSYRHRPDDPTSLAGNAVEALVVNPDGTFWVGTDGGLNAFDPASGHAVRILSQPGRRDGLPNNWVPDLMRTHDGHLWVGTQGGACVLTSWDGRNARFENVAERTGRAPAPVESLLEDAQGWVWLGPRLRVDPRTWRSQELGPADGCPFRNFFFASRLRMSDGTLAFGSPEGLLLVHPERLTPSPFVPPVVATALRVDGQERPGAARRTSLTLAPGERGFRLDFAALDFTAPDKVTYRHRLEGFDPGWLAPDAQGSLAYTNLAPGEYVLRVQGTNRQGRWSEHELRLPVTVRPAFYQTLAFRALLAALALALAYGIYRLRVRRLEERGLELERLVGERTRELAEAYTRIEEASLTDPLTGLRNRRFLEQTLESDLEIVTRRHAEAAENPPTGADLVFLLLDLDRFKSINDTYGHAAGDAVLVQTAAVLRGVLRASDHLVRWGGEEFLAVVRFVDRKEAPALAEKVRAALAAHPFQLADGTVLRRTTSIGYAAYPGRPGSGWEEVVAQADAGLYKAKETGRDRAVGVVDEGPAQR